MLTSELPNTEITRYMRGIRQVASVMEMDSRLVLRGEVGAVLKTWAGRTKVATQKQTDRRARYRAIRALGYTKANDRGDVTVNSGFKSAPFGRVWIKVRHGSGRRNFLLAMGSNFSKPAGSGVFNKYGVSPSATTQRWIANVSDAVADVQAAVPEAIEAGRKAIGLARQSVVQIADSLSIKLEQVVGGGTLSAQGIAKAREALASNGQRYVNGVGEYITTATTALYGLINGLPYALPAKMDRTLQGVLIGRARYYQRNLEEGVFLSAAKTARAYPFLSVSRN